MFRFAEVATFWMACLLTACAVVMAATAWWGTWRLSMFAVAATAQWFAFYSFRRARQINDLRNGIKR